MMDLLLLLSCNCQLPAMLLIHLCKCTLLPQNSSFPPPPHPPPVPRCVHWPSSANTTYQAAGLEMVQGGLYRTILLPLCCRHALQHICNTLGQYKWLALAELGSPDYAVYFITKNPTLNHKTRPSLWMHSLCLLNSFLEDLSSEEVKVELLSSGIQFMQFHPLWDPPTQVSPISMKMSLPHMV